jgi:hypothetical protein
MGYRVAGYRHTPAVTVAKRNKVGAVPLAGPGGDTPLEPGIDLIALLEKSRPLRVAIACFRPPASQPLADNTLVDDSSRVRAAVPGRSFGIGPRVLGIPSMSGPGGRGSRPRTPRMPCRPS